MRDLLTTMTPHQRLFVSGVATKPQIVELLTDEATSDALVPAAVVELEALLDAPRWLPAQAGPTVHEVGPRHLPGPAQRHAGRARSKR